MSAPRGGVCSQGMGSVCSRGVSAPRGVLAGECSGRSAPGSLLLGGICSRGGSASRGCLLWGVSAPGRGSARGGGGKVPPPPSY